MKIHNTLLVVLYKMDLLESDTIKSIISYVEANGEASEEFNLIIWDNSPTQKNHSLESLVAKLELLDFQYIPAQNNTSLSKIYNKIAENLTNEQYLTILDQDTKVGFQYFEQLKVAQSDRYSLILPKIKCCGCLVSPGTRFYCRGRLFSSIQSGKVKSKNLLAINSGMSVHSSVFKKITYDERLMFYGTDTFFMKQYEKYFSFAYVLDVELQHSLAEMENKSPEWHMKNKKEKFRTFKIIFSDSLLERFFVNVYIYMGNLKIKFSGVE